MFVLNGLDCFLLSTLKAMTSKLHLSIDVNDIPVLLVYNTNASKLQMNGVLGHNSALYWAGTTWANEVNFSMNHDRLTC